MTATLSGPHLSDISTYWTDLKLALLPSAADGAAEARRRQIERYEGAIFRYLRKSTGSDDAACELFQDFSLRFVRGNFRHADPEKGRFRDYLKAALRRLIADHFGKRAALGPLPADDLLPDPDALSEADAAFLDDCRADIIRAAWDNLASLERADGRPLFTVLRLRVDRDDAKAEELAGLLSARLGRIVDARWVHKWVYNARVAYTSLVVEGVRLSLDDPTPDEVEEELIALGLHDYCRRSRGRRK